LTIWDNLCGQVGKLILRSIIVSLTISARPRWASVYLCIGGRDRGYLDACELTNYLIEILGVCRQ